MAECAEYWALIAPPIMIDTDIAMKNAKIKLFIIVHLNDGDEFLFKIIICQNPEPG